MLEAAGQALAVRYPLTQGQFALVDAQDVASLQAHGRWRAVRTQDRWYAKAHLHAGKNSYTSIAMHRFILDAPKGMQVDHINGDGLDNRRANLRLVDGHQNQMNQHAAYGRSHFKGVSAAYKGGWRAEIRLDGKSVWLGHFSNEVDAARAYDAAARKHFKEYAAVNFPDAELMQQLEHAKDAFAQALAEIKRLREALSLLRDSAVLAHENGAILGPKFVRNVANRALAGDPS